GEQRKYNYALQPMSKEAFIDMMTTDLPEAPSYFSKDAVINREGPAILAELPPPAPLSAADVQARQPQGPLLLDTRPSDQYGGGHIPGSMNIGLSGQFASWSGTLVPLNTPLILVTENESSALEARTRLARVGHENVVGYLNGGVLAWHDAALPLS